MSRMNYNRAFDLAERDLIGGLASGLDGVFGSNGATTSNNDPFGIGGLTSILSPIIPGFGQSSTSASSSSTLTLTAASSTATSVSSSPSASASSHSVASTSLSSASSSTAPSTSSSPADSTTSAPATESTQTPTPTDSPAVSSTYTPSVLSSSSTSPSSAALPAASPKGFLQNKALSVGVITASSLVGLILFIALATWAVRRRSRSKLHNEAVDWSPFPSSDELLAGRNDVESANSHDKGSGIPGEARRTSQGSASVSGTGHTSQSESSAEPSSSSHSNLTAPQTREMYERTGYPALPVFIPAPASASRQPQYPNNQQPYPTQNPMYNDSGSYPSYNSNAYRANAPLIPRSNNLDGPHPRGLVSRPSQRKQVPALLPLNINAARADISPPAYPGGLPAPSPMSAISLNSGPLQPSSSTNPANPRTSPMERQTTSRKHSSLLNSPVQLAYASSDSSQEGRVREQRHLSVSQPPVMTTLPDEFGSVAAVSGDEKAALRRLTVRNE